MGGQDWRGAQSSRAQYWRTGKAETKPLLLFVFCFVFLLECDFGVILFVLQVICNPYEYIYIYILKN